MSVRAAFVVGWPVAHSRSPLIHRYWLRQYGIEGSYARAAVPPEEAAAFMASLASNGYVGGNVTVPYKETAFRACRHVTPVAQRLEAVNTLWLEGGDLYGDNSDIFGFAANLDDQWPSWRSGRSTLILGAGGAARSVISAVLQAGFESVTVANRTATRAQVLAALFGPKVQPISLANVSDALPTADLVVNTTSAGMTGSESLDIPWTLARAGTLVTDIVYVPLITPFLQGARDAGFTIVDGLGMLLHQAVPGFERWFGVRPEVTPELRALIEADIAG